MTKSNSNSKSNATRSSSAPILSRKQKNTLSRARRRTEKKSLLFPNSVDSAESRIQLTDFVQVSFRSPHHRLIPLINHIPYMKITGHRDAFENTRKVIMMYYKQSLNGICPNIGPQYVATSTKNAEILITIWRPTNRRNKAKLIGFAAVEVDDDELHVDLICSSLLMKGGGTMIMKSLDAILRATSLPAITLDAVQDAVPFYLKMGYVINPNPKSASDSSSSSSSNSSSSSSSSSSSRSRSRSRPRPRSSSTSSSRPRPRSLSTSSSRSRPRSTSSDGSNLVSMIKFL